MRFHHNLFAVNVLITVIFPHLIDSLLLSNIPTPSFIIDVEALQAVVSLKALQPPGERTGIVNSSLLLPSIRLPSNGLQLHPHIISTNKGSSQYECSSYTVDVSFHVNEGQPSIGFFHSSVLRARDDVIPVEDDPVSTFLAEIDLDPTLCGFEEGTFYGDNHLFKKSACKLVLGRNNHHVGSYYWARSAGAGASMEAPGISFGCDCKNSQTAKNRGKLRWNDERGPTFCNSNDGKRSEWVNYLRKGDTVQLVPKDGQNSLLQFSKSFFTDKYSSMINPSISSSLGHIFGISSKCRPMGSEPEVICEWKQTLH